MLSYVVELHTIWGHKNYFEFFFKVLYQTELIKISI